MAKRKEFWLTVNDGLVALQEVAHMQGSTFDMQGVLSPIAREKRKQHERFWQFQVMRADVLGDWGDLLIDRYQKQYTKTGWGWSGGGNWGGGASSSGQSP